MQHLDCKCLWGVTVQGATPQPLARSEPFLFRPAGGAVFHGHRPAPSKVTSAAAQRGSALPRLVGLFEAVFLHLAHPASVSEPLCS